MSTDELIAPLRKLRFFEEYSDDAARRAEARIREPSEDGMNGPGREDYERFPGFSLAFIALPGEWDFEPHEPIVEMVAGGSFGMFTPTEISDRRDEEGDTATLSFTVAGERHSTTAERTGWVPPEFLELIERAFRKHCGDLHFFETFWPEAGDSCSWTFCTKRAHKALVKGRLLPGHPDDVREIDGDSA